ncbi:AMP nucleosidase [Escherichia coli]|nr:AMP nucleosidase [Escherichia coli]TJJ07214.1 AMP nucleosidase [Escherichia coli]TJJ27897.1 AMP nucleosidase [Escherichia coli]
MIWQPEFTDKILSRKPGAVHCVLHPSVDPTVQTRLSALIRFYLLNLSGNV